MTTTTRNIIEELRRAATEQGAGEAVRTIAGPALETWMRALDGKDADPERLDDLATLMTARLSIRDAALIAAVEPKLDTATVIDMAARPHASNNKTLLTETLKAAFDDPHIRPDETRLARAVREACAMADRARKHGGPVAQPYALAAYLAWWDGDGKAATLAALAALDDDPETSLAIMVATMAASGRYPRIPALTDRKQPWRPTAHAIGRHDGKDTTPCTRTPSKPPPINRAGRSTPDSPAGNGSNQQPAGEDLTH